MTTERVKTWQSVPFAEKYLLVENAWSNSYPSFTSGKTTIITLLPWKRKLRMRGLPFQKLHRETEETGAWTAVSSIQCSPGDSLSLHTWEVTVRQTWEQDGAMHRPHLLGTAWAWLGGPQRCVHWRRLRTLSLLKRRLSVENSKAPCWCVRRILTLAMLLSEPHLS